jgi:hypothetical protein
MYMQGAGAVVAAVAAVVVVLPCCNPMKNFLGASFNLSVSLTWDARHSAMGQYHVQGSNQLHGLISEVTLL